MTPLTMYSPSSAHGEICCAGCGKAAWDVTTSDIPMKDKRKPKAMAAMRTFMSLFPRFIVLL
jgi:hypothetical protein